MNSGWRADYYERAQKVARAASLYGHELKAWPLPSGSTGAGGHKWKDHELGDGRRAWVLCRRCRMAGSISTGSDRMAEASMEKWMLEPCDGGGKKPEERTLRIVQDHELVEELNDDEP